MLAKRLEISEQAKFKSNRTTKKQKKEKKKHANNKRVSTSK